MEDLEQATEALLQAQDSIREAQEKVRRAFQVVQALAARAAAERDVKGETK